MDQNILYLDLDTGLVKHSHHAQFDEAWYLQLTCPPATQLLYNLGLEADEDSHITVDTTDSAKENHIRVLPAPWPPLPPHKLSELTWHVPPLSCITPLPLREMELPRLITAAAARVPSLPNATPRTASDMVSKYNITRNDMAMIYMSPDPYFEAFEEVIDMTHFDLNKHWTAGLFLAHVNGRLHLGGMAPSTPAAKIPCWHLRIKAPGSSRSGTGRLRLWLRLMTHSNNSLLTALPLFPSYSCTRKSARTYQAMVSLLCHLPHSHNTFMISSTTDEIF